MWQKPKFSKRERSESVWTVIYDHQKTWLTFHTRVIALTCHVQFTPSQITLSTLKLLSVRFSLLLFFSIRLWPLILTLKADLCMDFPLLHVSFTFLFIERTIYVTLLAVKSTYPASESAMDSLFTSATEWKNRVLSEVLI